MLTVNMVTGDLSQPKASRDRRKKLIFYSIMLVIYLLNSQWGEFVDEWDNVVGGKLIKDGVLPYTGFASQHFPLPYFVSFFINLLSGTNFIFFRILFALILFTWAVCIYRYVKTRENDTLLKYFFLLFAFTSGITSMQMFLADTFVAYAALSIFLIAYYKFGNFTMKDLYAISLCSFIILGSSLGYLFLSFTAYALVAWVVVTRRRLVSFQRRGALILVLVVPYLVLLCYLLLSGSLGELYWQNVIFNRKYYFNFFGEFPSKSYLLPFFVIRKFGQSYWQLLANFSLKNILYIIFLLSDLAFFMYLIKKRLYSLLFFVIPFVIFSTTRMNIELEIVNHNNMPFYPLSLFFFSFLSYHVFSHCFADYDSFRRDRVAFTGMLMTVIFFFFLSHRVLSNYYDLLNGKRITNGHPVSEMINQLLRKEESFWIGPTNIKEYYFAERKVGTRHLWYAPWHAASPEVNRELFEDLARNKPTVIVFYREVTIWGHPVEQYAQGLMDYLHKNYFQTEVLQGGARESNVYLLKEKREDLFTRQKGDVKLLHSFNLIPRKHFEGGITAATRIFQTFVSPYANLRGIYLHVATFGKQIRTPYRLLLKDGHCETPIRESDLDVSRIKDNDFFSITFAPIADSKGKKYCFTLVPVSERVETPITVRFSDPDAYQDGETIVNGERKKEALSFQLIY